MGPKQEEWKNSQVLLRAVYSVSKWTSASMILVKINLEIINRIGMMWGFSWQTSS